MIVAIRLSIQDKIEQASISRGYTLSYLRNEEKQAPIERFDMKPISI